MMTESELAKFAINEVEKVRTRLHVTENSLASTSHAMLTFNKNMSEIIEMQKQQSEELQFIKDQMKSVNTFKSIVKNPTTWIAVIAIGYIYEKIKVAEFLNYIKDLF